MLAFALMVSAFPAAPAAEQNDARQGRLTECSAKDQARRKTKVTRRINTLTKVFARVGLAASHAEAVWQQVPPERRLLKAGDMIEYVPGSSRSDSKGVAWIRLFADAPQPVEICATDQGYARVTPAIETLMPRLSNVTAHWIVEYQPGDANLKEALQRAGVPEADIDDLLNKKGMDKAVQRFGADSGPVLIEHNAEEWWLCLRYSEYRWYSARTSLPHAARCYLDSQTRVFAFAVERSISEDSPASPNFTADMSDFLSFALDTRKELRQGDRLEILSRQWIFHGSRVRESLEALWFYGRKKAISVHKFGTDDKEKPLYAVGDGSGEYYYFAENSDIKKAEARALSADELSHLHKEVLRHHRTYNQHRGTD